MTGKPEVHAEIEALYNLSESLHMIGMAYGRLSIPEDAGFMARQLMDCFPSLFMEEPHGDS